jgi:hypothetical protein
MRPRWTTSDASRPAIARSGRRRLASACRARARFATYRRQTPCIHLNWAVRALSFLLAIQFPASLVAQVAADTGARLRVDVPARGRIIGRFVALSRDSVFILRCQACQRDAIARSDIRGVEVSRGREESPLRVMAFGVVGAGVGALVGAKSVGHCTDGPCGILILPAAAAGSVLGSIVGLHFKVEHWIPTRLP